MEIQPVKTLEKVLRPVVAPFIGHITKAIATVGRLPKLAIIKFQQIVRVNAADARNVAEKLRFDRLLLCLQKLFFLHFVPTRFDLFYLHPPSCDRE